MESARGSERHKIHTHSLRKFFNNALIAAGMLDIHREYLMSHAIPTERKAYFDNTGPGREEILKAYKEAYPKLSIKATMNVPDELQEKFSEYESRIMKLELEMQRLNNLVEKQLSKSEEKPIVHQAGLHESPQ